MNSGNIIVLITVTLSLFLTGCSESKGHSSSDQSVITDPIVTPQPDPYKTAGWYAKTEISATDEYGEVYSHSTAGVFGELVQSEDTRDKHDIPAMGSSIIRVVFLQSDWADEDNGAYFSDYRKYNPDNIEKQVWTFQVKNQEIVDLSYAPIEIELEGVYDVKYRDDRGSVEYKELPTVDTEKVTSLILVDVDNGNEYTVEQLTTANLTMEGLHTRTFRWVLGSVDSTDYEPLPAPQRAAGRTAVPEFKAASAKTSGGKFGLPPQ